MRIDESGDRRGPHSAGMADLIVGVLLAGGILVLGVPRIPVELTVLRWGEPIRLEEQAGVVTGDPALCIAGDDLAGQAAAFREARLFGLSARAEVLCGRPDYAQRALPRTEERLARGPADPATWLRRVHLQEQTLRWDGAVQSWNLSVGLGRFDPAIMPTRIEAAIVLWPFLDVTARDSLREQIVLLHAADPVAMTRVLTRHRRHEAVERVLAGEPAVRETVDRARPPDPSTP
ncbi:MAG: hypothetical protein RLY86_638 [Pseudomonadota bacterium]|jgi:hypothetical protein